VEAFHHKLASLYWKFAAEAPTDQVILHMYLKMGSMDRKQFGESLKQHAIWSNKLIRLEELAGVAEMAGDEEWMNEIHRELDRHLLNTTGGS